MKGGQSNRFFCGLQNPAIDMLSSLYKNTDSPVSYLWKKLLRLRENLSFSGLEST